MDVVKGEGIVPVLFVVVDFESAVWWSLCVSVDCTRTGQTRRKNGTRLAGWDSGRFPLLLTRGVHCTRLVLDGAKNTKQIPILGKVNSPNTGAGANIEHPPGILDRCKV